MASAIRWLRSWSLTGHLPSRYNWAQRPHVSILVADREATRAKLHPVRARRDAWHATARHATRREVVADSGRDVDAPRSARDGVAFGDQVVRRAGGERL